MIEDFKRWFVELSDDAKARKIASSLETGTRQKWTNPVKNKEIKEKFSREGLRIEGVKPRSSADKKAGEWLYDLIWREFDSENNFVSVMLAMEIELSDMAERGLVYDFDKLLQSDSEYKIFVFQQQTKVQAEHLFNRFRLRSESYNHKLESIFLFCCWSWDSGTFLFNEFNGQVHS